MTAEETISLARKEGIRLELSKGEVAWEGPRKPSPLLLANLKFHQSALVRMLGSALDQEDKDLLRQAGLPPDDPAVVTAIRLFGGKVRAVRKAGSKGLIQRKGK
jgi:hypothetical protein